MIDADEIVRLRKLAPDLANSTTILALLDALEQSQTVLRDMCKWAMDDSDFASWATSCGEEFVIIEGTPEHNSMRFCCYCGKPLVAVLGQAIAATVEPAIAEHGVGDNVVLPDCDG